MNPSLDQNAASAQTTASTVQEPWVVTKDGKRASRGMTEEQARQASAAMNRVEEGSGASPAFAPKRVLFG
jgi:hypothetical protein